MEGTETASGLGLIEIVILTVKETETGVTASVTEMGDEILGMMIREDGTIATKGWKDL